VNVTLTWGTRGRQTEGRTLTHTHTHTQTHTNTQKGKILTLENEVLEE